MDISIKGSLNSLDFDLLSKSGKITKTLNPRNSNYKYKNQGIIFSFRQNK